MQVEKLEEVEITSQQRKLWSDTRAALIWHCPAFTHILYTMMAKDRGEHIAIFTRSFPNVAATDGTRLLINPDRFFDLPLLKRIFVVAHEISHCMFGHVELMYKLRLIGRVRYPDGVELKYDDELMNMAMDYVINDMLIESQIGEYDQQWLHNKQIATHMDDVLSAYRKLLSMIPPGMEPQRARGGQESFDAHLDPGKGDNKDAGQAVSERSDIEWKSAIAGAVATGRAQGKMPAALKRLLDEVMEPTVDWTDAVVGYFNRKPGGGSYNWRKADRRLVTRGIISPARSGYGCGTLVCGVDTSGSVGDREVAVFFGNMAGILEDLKPQRLIIMWCDAYVHRVDEVYDYMDLIDIRLHKGAPGGGGTSFVPVFDKIEEEGIEPDALIYLTDGLGRFPDQAPSYSVLWGDIAKSKYPFGDVIHVPIKA